MSTIVPMASVVIPAHNEADVIGRCLDRLLSGGGDEFEVVVVANACTDRTASLSRRRGVTVVETDRAGKAPALNLGDRHCSTFPRIYLDADVELDRLSALELAAALRTPGALAAAPRLRWSPDGLTRAVRAYYRVWSALPYVSADLLGSGVYGLSEAGRRRFGSFPEIIGDDAFVAGLFRPHERRFVTDASFTIHPPRTLRSLVAVKSRVWAGNEQLARRGGRVSGTGGGGRRLAALRAHPDVWTAVPVYVLVYSLTRLFGWWRLRTNRTRWTRDDSSRSAGQAADA